MSRYDIEWFVMKAVLICDDASNVIVSLPSVEFRSRPDANASSEFSEKPNFCLRLSEPWYLSIFSQALLM